MDNMKILIEEFATLCAKKVQKWLNELYKDHPERTPHPSFKIEYSRKYIRLKSDGRIYGFIDATNGDLLKAATWRAPAKHARGNLYKKETWAACIGAQSLDKDIREENRQEKLIEQSIEKKAW